MFDRDEWHKQQTLNEALTQWCCCKEHLMKKSLRPIVIILRVVFCGPVVGTCSIRLCAQPLSFVTFRTMSYSHLPRYSVMARMSRMRICLVTTIWFILIQVWYQATCESFVSQVLVPIILMHEFTIHASVSLCKTSHCKCGVVRGVLEDLPRL